MRDPNDKLYRMGNGFSKMLQMIQIDENEKLMANNYATTQNFYNNSGRNQNVNENLPKINQHNNNQTSDNNNNNQNNNIAITEDDDENQPKIMKIYKKNK